MTDHEHRLVHALHSDDDPELTPVLTALHDRLAERAQAADLLDIAYRTLDSPVGRLLLAATPRGLVRVAYPGEDHDEVLARLARQLSPRILQTPARLDTAVTELDEYFAGQRRRFDVPVDLALAHGFRAAVLRHLRSAVPYGTTASYSTVAAAAGSPNAVRAAGTACATNPLPIVIPCHRVLRSDGTLGRYVGGAANKQTLLSLESAS